MEIYPYKTNQGKSEVAFSLEVIKDRGDVSYYTITEISDEVYAILTDINKYKEAKILIDNFI